MTKLRNALPAIVSAALAVACGASTYVRTVGVGQGHSLSFVEATPKPGTVLVVGDTVEFAVTVRYHLGITSQGSVFLVFQNHSVPLYRGRPQARVEVTRGSGAVTLADTIVVPRGLGILSVFVPLMPLGAMRTSGELLLSYPVARRPN